MSASAVRVPVGLTELAASAAHQFGDAVAQRFLVDGEWRQRSFVELHDVVAAIARVLHEGGVRPGMRVALLCATRPEWTICDLAITRLGAVCVPIYPTSSTGQIQWVLRDSAATAVVAETAQHLEQIAQLRDELPDLRLVWGIEAFSTLGAALADLTAAPGPTAGASTGLPQVEADPDEVFTIVYTSGTTGNPKGCMFTHANVSTIVATLQRMTETAPVDVLFAYLPLAHLLTRMLQVYALHTGAAIAYSSGNIRAILGELAEVAPTHLPSVPTLFEKIYSVVTAQITAEGNIDRAGLAGLVELGLRVRNARDHGGTLTEEDARRFAEADERLFAPVRAAFGGRLKAALTGAAPIAANILEFFFAAGVPIFEAYGMTESTAIISANTPGAWRAGTVGRPVPGVDVRIAEDGEVCARSAGVFPGYWHNEAATAQTIVDGWLHTGDLGALDADGFLQITGRKKDMIITSAGKNITPANLENDLRQSSRIAEAVMLGDHRPYPVALIVLEPEQLAVWAEHGETDDDAWVRDEELHGILAVEIDAVNARYSPPERIRAFAVLPAPFTIESGELTPTFKVRRAVVAQHYAQVVDSLYP